MADITPIADSPINRLFFAINYYVSTGDHIGEGVAQPDTGGIIRLLIPYNPRELEDKDNFDRLRGRLAQLAETPGTPRFALTHEGQSRQFVVWALKLSEADCDALADLLVAEPGPMGWGSCKMTIDQIPREAWVGRLPGQQQEDR